MRMEEDGDENQSSSNRLPEVNWWIVVKFGYRSLPQVQIVSGIARYEQLFSSGCFWS